MTKAKIFKGTIVERDYPDGHPVVLYVFDGTLKLDSWVDPAWYDGRKVVTFSGFYQHGEWQFLDTTTGRAHVQFTTDMKFGIRNGPGDTNTPFEIQWENAPNWIRLAAKFELSRAASSKKVAVS